MPLNNLMSRWTYWLTSEQHNLRSFSILRILYGVGILLLLVPSIRERSFLWGKASFWVDPEASRRGFLSFDLFMPKDAPVLFEFAFFGLILLAVLFTVGWYTRLVLPLMLILLIGLQANNPYVLNGGDTLMRITLVFMLFANLSAHYSLDARRKKRMSERGTKRKRIVARHVSNSAHNVGLILSCFQIIVVYLVSGVWKLTGTEWLDGTALFYALRIDAFMLYPMLNDLLWQSTLLLYIATFIALWAQTLFPLAILWRPTRIIALITLMGMHFGIAVLMGLWPFSLAMIALDMLFIRDSTWVSINNWLDKRSSVRKLKDLADQAQQENRLPDNRRLSA